MIAKCFPKEPDLDLLLTLVGTLKMVAFVALAFASILPGSHGLCFVRF
jgi:hypothetical protein